MDPRVNTLERAFELARSGQYANSAEIKRALHLEGYSHWQVSGPTLIKQINQLCKSSRVAQAQ